MKIIGIQIGKQLKSLILTFHVKISPLGFETADFHEAIAMQCQVSRATG